MQMHLLGLKAVVNVPGLLNLRVAPSKVEALVRSMQVGELRSGAHALAPWRWQEGPSEPLGFPDTFQGQDTPRHTHTLGAGRSVQILGSTLPHHQTYIH